MMSRPRILAALVIGAMLVTGFTLVRSMLERNESSEDLENSRRRVDHSSEMPDLVGSRIPANKVPFTSEYGVNDDAQRRESNRSSGDTSVGEAQPSAFGANQRAIEDLSKEKSSSRAWSVYYKLVVGSKPIEAACDRVLAQSRMKGDKEIREKLKEILVRYRGQVVDAYTSLRAKHGLALPPVGDSAEESTRRLTAERVVWREMSDAIPARYYEDLELELSAVLGPKGGSLSYTDLVLGP